MAGGKRIAVLAESEFEDLEMWYPVLRLREAGHEVTVVGSGSAPEYKGKYGLKIKVDKNIDEVSPQDFDGLVVPGGWAPDKMRRYPAMVDLVRVMDESKKPIASICHGGWMLASARVCQGRRLASTPGIRHDLENAGATWIDEPAVVDGHHVSARRPEDLPDFMREYLKLLEH